LDTFCFFAT